MKHPLKFEPNLDRVGSASDVSETAVLVYNWHFLTHIRMKSNAVDSKIIRGFEISPVKKLMSNAGL